MSRLSLDTLLKLAEQGHFHREHNHDGGNCEPCAMLIGCLADLRTLESAPAPRAPEARETACGIPLDVHPPLHARHRWEHGRRVCREVPDPRTWEPEPAPAEGATMFGVPVMADPSLPDGVVRFAFPDGRLETIDLRASPASGSTESAPCPACGSTAEGLDGCGTHACYPAAPSPEAEGPRACELCGHAAAVHDASGECRALVRDRAVFGANAECGCAGYRAPGRSGGKP